MENATKNNTTMASSRTTTTTTTRHRRHRRRRRLVRESSTSDSPPPMVILPLFHADGTYHVHLWVGSPIPQRLSVIVDTASHLTAFPCHSSTPTTTTTTTTSNHHRPFDPTRSETFSISICPDDCIDPTTGTTTTTTTTTMSSICHVQSPRFTNGSSSSSQSSLRPPVCHWAQSYAEGSAWTAIQVQDLVYASGPSLLDASSPWEQQWAIPFLFGCFQEVQGPYFSHQWADGILGLSSQLSTTLPQQLYHQGIIPSPLFSICFKKLPQQQQRRTESAGIMVLGGIHSDESSSLNVTYAQNIQPSGLFTLHVRNIFIAPSTTSTTHSVNDSPSSRHLEDVAGGVQIPNEIIRTLNTGKGVIVDSGTTDTYLNQHVLPHFETAWKATTGKRHYSHSPLTLTHHQLHQLPTIWMQFRAADYQPEADSRRRRNSPTTLGQQVVGEWDPQHPNDLLWKLPPEHYMEFNPGLGKYTPRLYFTESKGGVLGANAMQGHIVVFDSLYSRIGLMPSDCDDDTQRNHIPPDDAYSEEYAQSLGHHPHANNNENNKAHHVRSPCVLEDTMYVKTPCIQSISFDMDRCRSATRPEGVELVGTEVWSRLVLSTGSDPKSCEQVALQSAKASAIKVECMGNGICTETRQCQMTCTDILDMYKSTTTQINMLDFRSPTIPDDDEPPMTTTCHGSGWSACDVGCEQSKICFGSVQSRSKNRGDSYNSLLPYHTVRPCHVDGCGITDPCQVPFIVYSILHLETTNQQEWYSAVWGNDDFLQTLVTRVSHMPQLSSIAARRRLFSEGDVKVVSVKPWTNSSRDEMNQTRGITIMLSVSISDSGANAIQTGLQGREMRNAAWSSSHLPPTGPGQQLWEILSRPFRGVPPATHSTCDPFVLFPLAKDAVELADGILKHPAFGDYLAQGLTNCSKAKVVSSWTTGIQVYDDAIKDYSSNGTTLNQTQLIYLWVAFGVSVFLFIVSLLSCLGQDCPSLYRVVVRILRRKLIGKKTGSWYLEKLKEADEMNDGDSLDRRGSSFLSPSRGSYHASTTTTTSSSSSRHTIDYLEGDCDADPIPIEFKKGRTPNKRYSAIRQFKSNP